MTRFNWLATAALAAGIAAPNGAAAQTHSNGETHRAMKDIVTVAVEAGSFKTLVTAVQAAGLEETLRGEGPFTVFAPTDEAFAKLPAGTVQALLADPEKLAAILKYHVVPGRIGSTEIVAAGGAKPATALGPALTIRIRDGRVLVDEATVVSADVAASNGVIHVIDTVVLPKEAATPAGAR
jgi:uncharacterized surface protein with fasciclin (FAS1) repeats